MNSNVEKATQIIKLSKKILDTESCINLSNKKKYNSIYKVKDNDLIGLMLYYFGDQLKNKKEELEKMVIEMESPNNLKTSISIRL